MAGRYEEGDVVVVIRAEDEVLVGKRAVVRGSLQRRTTKNSRVALQYMVVTTDDAHHGYVNETCLMPVIKSPLARLSAIAKK